ncbi:MAG: hypothetical protein Q8L07_06425 [Sediminibacterium sp.]|nr:hypothetical protein [Sediminibacterium sp.]
MTIELRYLYNLKHAVLNYYYVLNRNEDAAKRFYEIELIDNKDVNNVKESLILEKELETYTDGTKDIIMSAHGKHKVRITPEGRKAFLDQKYQILARAEKMNWPQRHWILWTAITILGGAIISAVATLLIVGR